MEKILTCIECPRGCTLSVTGETGNFTVTGNFCVRGEKYAKNEVTCPVRVVTSTVRFKDKMVAVKTDKPIKKELIFEVMNRIHQTSLLTSVKAGAIIIENIDGDGANLIATSSVSEE